MTTLRFITTFRQGNCNIRIANTVLAQILFQARIPKTPRPRDDTLSGVARIGKQALTLQGVEHGVEFIFRLGLTGEFSPQLDPAEITPGQKLQGLNSQIRHRPPIWLA